MNADTLLFFAGHEKALPLYEALENRILKELGPVEIRVQKSQISFYNRHLFACASFLRIRRKKDCPDPFLVVTFGLNRRVESRRIEGVVEPYPNRWTHHVLMSSPEEVDGELMDWLREAADFSNLK